ncbi:hypothetical protein BJV82DRAFT_676438 [Fennellomyces sp. T-0311]|nr:hypothetical protein BJV82DRAFT_676438 [Fennellomyces sp. T-0311]
MPVVQEHLPILRIQKRTDEYERFQVAIAQHCYIENAFPSPEEYRLACVKIVNEIKGTSETHPIDNELLDSFTRIHGARRTSLHSGVHDWLRQYFGEVRRLLSGLHLEKDQDICAHLLKNNRFARRDMELRTPFLYSQAIIDCICATLLNTAGGPARLKPFPETINRYTISLITLMMKYRIAKIARSELVEAGSGGSTFSGGSDWDYLYEDMLSSEGEMGKMIDWTAIERFITAGVIKRKGCRLAQRSALDLFGPIDSIEDSLLQSDEYPHAKQVTNEQLDNEQYGEEQLDKKQLDEEQLDDEQFDEEESDEEESDEEKSDEEESEEEESEEEESEDGRPIYSRDTDDE